MTKQTITCPKCNHVIQLDEALSTDIKNQLETQFSQDFKKKLDAEKIKMWEIAQKKATEKINTELKDMQEVNIEKDKQIQEMREHELEIRKEKRELEEEKKNLKLEVERKLDQERDKISQQAKKEATEETRLKMAEKDKQMDQLRKSLEDAKRKSEQGSMQIQGDVQEDDLKIILLNAYPSDAVEDVPAGVRGADLVQTVKTPFGQKAGVILWESKNTKAWSENWIKKLKGDQALVKADICILVSQSLPDGVKDFKYQNSVWVCSYQSVMSLVSVIRIQLIQINQIKQSLVGKDEKMEVLYNYLSGNEFRNRVENIVTAFTSMQSDLETEKRSMQRIWQKRQKEIERVITSTSGMYGDLQGIVGASLPTIKSLELPSGNKEVKQEELIKGEVFSQT